MSRRTNKKSCINTNRRAVNKHFLKLYFRREKIFSQIMETFTFKTNEGNIMGLIPQMKSGGGKHDPKSTRMHVCILG